MVSDSKEKHKVVRRSSVHGRQAMVESTHSILSILDNHHAGPSPGASQPMTQHNTFPFDNNMLFRVTPPSMLGKVETRARGGRKVR